MWHESGNVYRLESIHERGGVIWYLHYRTIMNIATPLQTESTVNCRHKETNNKLLKHVCVRLARQIQQIFSWSSVCRAPFLRTL